MKNIWLISLSFLFFLISSQSWATYDSLTFGSSKDFFKLKGSKDDYTLNGKKVDLGTFAEFLPLLSQEPQEKCPELPAKPTLTIKAQDGRQILSRHFYIPQKIMSDGKLCLKIGGDGIYYLPLHRRWFKGNTSFNLALKDSVTLVLPDKSEISAQRVDGKWRAQKSDSPTQPQWFVNWSFFDRFAKSLSSFPIDARLHPIIGKDRPQAEIKEGLRSYKFYLVGENLWAVQTPGHNWLLASNSWSFWEDLNKGLFTDRHSEHLQVLADPKNKLDQRLEALQAVATRLSPATKHLIEDRLLDPSENTQLQLKMVNTLKQRPSLDNMGLLIKALLEASSAAIELKAQITLALRIRHPEGPLIKEDLDHEENEKAINYWQKWWKDQSHSSQNP